jgi:predicted DNA-binding ribbon-helix-helix protein
LAPLQDHCGRPSSWCNVVESAPHDWVTMRPLAEKTARLSVSLNQSDYDALDRLAGQNDVSIAWLVRKAIERLLETNPQRDLFRSDEILEVTRR